MSFQLTLFSMLFLLIAVVVGQPIQSQNGDLKMQAVQDNSPLNMEAFNDDSALYDYLEQSDPSLKSMEKRWANQVRFGKRASWASSVRFG
ncbi:WANQVRF-amide [Caenorhabditis elegans]|uniref:FMRFamide-like neuropeptides 19 n=1 Tax=Caenorhabditis elegans TaxID=6239 RepID=FLP19_CAEEL|nr:WANQVRF-amide [Caenorhabditis elegans]Q9XVX1.1 RecName: Full=FMRFamide-like neuropeptides 19; Contains: RecName: Full=WANQVRF-amide; Flags: Precursor [Caenorhabditis elegans]CAA90690.1 WANQVRF-amide [Caenorhabditis elegans]|eukprot:NP_509776.1 WANQVRF-amide [Caenorhabditis elegans]